MSNCPFCLEPIKDGARKCPHCQSSLEISGAKDDGNTIFIADKGLVRFAKFVGGTLAIFILIGIYLYGFDIKEANTKVAEAEKKTSEAELKVQKALLEIEKQKLALDTKSAAIEKQIARIDQLEQEIVAHREETKTTAATVKVMMLEIMQSREEAGKIVVGLRSLNSEQASRAEAKREERGISTTGRGRLWPTGSTVHFRFMDGKDREKEVVRRAVAEWSRWINLTLKEVDDPRAEIRISFSTAESWSYVGTDALGITPDKPTLHYWLPDDNDASMHAALHEFGHALGLVHEFQNPSAGDIFDMAKVRQIYKAQGWTDAAIEASFGKDKSYPGGRSYDRESVMSYMMPEDLFKPGMRVTPGPRLSASDQAYAGKLYPRN